MIFHSEHSDRWEIELAFSMDQYAGNTVIFLSIDNTCNTAWMDDIHGKAILHYKNADEAKAAIGRYMESLLENGVGGIAWKNVTKLT
jgi:hypothetical protein